MVHLYGVTHGGQWEEFFGRSGEIKVLPSAGLLEDLKKFPKGTKVGIESLEKKDLDEVEKHLLTLPFNPPLPRFSEDTFLRPYYGQGSHDYWEVLRKNCLEQGFKIVFLDQKEKWFKYNKALIKNVENEARRINLSVLEKGETKGNYHRKIIEFNLERYKEELLLKKIHEIERDKGLLHSIKSSKVEVAVVGEGHSSYWMANPEKIFSDFGIKFESYSTECLGEPVILGETIFNKNSKFNAQISFERRNLERGLKLLEDGRLSDRAPDFIGTWDIHNPLRGYFEMFVDRNGEKIKGEIVDCLGDADFEGEESRGEMRFVKQYRAIKPFDKVPGRVLYRGIIRGEEIAGFFMTLGTGFFLCNF